MDLMHIRRSLLSGEKPLIIIAVSGNPVSFISNVKKPLSECNVGFLPVQAGSGDPSPSNIRTIGGWTSLTIYKTINNNDPYTSESYTVMFPASAGTVFGGELDCITGKLKVKWTSVDLGTLNWELYNDRTSRQAWLARIYGIEDTTTNKAFSGKCEILKTVAYNDTWVPYNIALFSNQIFITFAHSAYPDANSVKEALNGVVLAYALATPYEIQLDPIILLSSKGTNTIWSNANDNIQVKYCTY